MTNRYTSNSLSHRLATLAAWVPRGAKVLDVGTDHALLPIHLVEEGYADTVIAADIVEGPYETARKNVMAAGLAQRVLVRLGSGLTVVTPGEVDTVIVAGMGGTTIGDILEASPDVTSSIQNLIVQPMNASRRLRETLQRLRFEIIDEKVIEEAGHMYQMIFAQPGQTEDIGHQYEPYIARGQAWLALEFGPVNLSRTENEWVRRAVLSAKMHLVAILEGISVDVVGAAADRREELTMQVHQMDSWLTDAAHGA